MTEIEQLKARIAELEDQLEDYKDAHMVHRYRAEKAESECERIWERCAEIVRNSCLLPPDGGSPLEIEVAAAKYAADLILDEREKWRK